MEPWDTVYGASVSAEPTESGLLPRSRTLGTAAAFRFRSEIRCQSYSSGRFDGHCGGNLGRKRGKLSVDRKSVVDESLIQDMREKAERRFNPSKVPIEANDQGPIRRKVAAAKLKVLLRVTRC